MGYQCCWTKTTNQSALLSHRMQQEPLPALLCTSTACLVHEGQHSPDGTGGSVTLLWPRNMQAVASKVHRGRWEGKFPDITKGSLERQRGFIALASPPACPVARGSARAASTGLLRVADGWWHCWWHCCGTAVASTVLPAARLCWAAPVLQLLTLGWDRLRPQEEGQFPSPWHPHLCWARSASLEEHSLCSTPSDTSPAIRSQSLQHSQEKGFGKQLGRHSSVCVTHRTPWKYFVSSALNRKTSTSTKHSFRIRTHWNIHFPCDK